MGQGEESLASNLLSDSARWGVNSEIREANSRMEEDD